MNLNILIMAANFVESSFLHQALIQVASALGSTPYMPQAVRILEENQPYVFIANYLFLAVTQYFCEKTKAIKIGSEQKVFIIFNDNDPGFWRR